MKMPELNWPADSMIELLDEVEESEKFIYDIKMEYRHPKKCLAEEKIDE